MSLGMPKSNQITPKFHQFCQKKFARRCGCILSTYGTGSNGSFSEEKESVPLTPQMHMNKITIGVDRNFDWEGPKRKNLVTNIWVTVFGDIDDDVITDFLKFDFIIVC